jgi:hypothetical protein
MQSRHAAGSWDGHDRTDGCGDRLHHGIQPLMAAAKPDRRDDRVIIVAVNACAELEATSGIVRPAIGRRMDRPIQ